MSLLLNWGAWFGFLGTDLASSEGVDDLNLFEILHPSPLCSCSKFLEGKTQV